MIKVKTSSPIPRASLTKKTKAESKLKQRHPKNKRNTWKQGKSELVTALQQCYRLCSTVLRFAALLYAL